MKPGLADRSLNWKYVAAFCLYLFIVLFLGFLNWRIQRANLIGLAKERLSSISRYKSNEIANWVKERTRDAKVLNLTGGFHREILALFENPRNKEQYDHVITHFKPMVDHYGYEDIVLSDLQGKIYASTRFWSDSLGYDSRKLLCRPIGLGGDSFSSFYYCGHHKSVHIDFYTPVLKDSSDSGSVVGMVLLRMNPEHYLYPLIQSWPVPSPTSETLLIEPVDDSVLYLNKLRHKPTNTLRFKIPKEGNKIAAAIAVRGYIGFVETLDYRGMEVLAYTRPVEGTPWFMVSKTDMDEVMAPMQGWQYRTGFALVILILLGALVFYLIAMQRRKEYYSKMYMLESQRLALVKHYELVLKRANDIILLLDAGGTITDCNEKAIREYGYSREELVGSNASMVIAPESQEEYIQFLEKEPGEQGFLFQAIHRRKDATTFPVEISSMVIDIEGKKFIHGIIRDISERIQYQHTIIKERNTAQNYLDITGSVIVVLDHDGNVSLINQQGLALLEYTREEVIGKNWFDHFITAGIRETIKGVFSKLINEEIESPEFFENTVLTASGQEKIIFCHNALIRDDAGNVTGTISSGEDITILRKKEQELEKLNQELEERVKKRTEQLETANKELESFSYSVSHDLRAPLRSIDGFSLALLEDQASKVDDKGKDYLKRIRNASQRMGLLIDELLRLSRITRHEVVVQDIDLSTMAIEICGELLDQDTKNRITLNIAGGITGKADPGLVKIALRNLFHNAFKFSAQVEHPEVVFDLVDLNGESVLMIRDNGAGFDMRYAGKLFGVFQRLHTPQEFEGTGIGLTIVQRIIHRHGGTVSATGEPGKGASFYINIPGLTKTL